MDSGQAPGLGKASHAQKLDLDNGTTAFMFLATSLVQLMTPGLAFFYSGMVGTKSTVATMFQSFIALGLVFTLWAICVFSLTFGQPLLTIGDYHLLGNPMTYFMMKGIQIYHPLQRAGAVVANGFPGMLFMAYQGMFAVITPALISGALVDRMRFAHYLIFIGIWMFLVYAPLGYWNWGGGWMFQIGAWDFAGGMVVHESAGFSALGCLLALGPRENPQKDPAPHSLVLLVLGTGMLWFGWFGFNGGSALTIGGLATIAFVNTQIAPAVALFTWMVLDWVVHGKPSILGACSGAICGLVVITPSAGFVQPDMAVKAGFLGAFVCFSATYFIRHRTSLDDTCDTVGVHGLGGFLGTVFVGMFSDPEECSSKQPPEWCANPGTVFRSFNQFGIQLLCAIVAAVYSMVVAYTMVRVMLLLVPKLTSEEQQSLCRDENEFGETAYKMEGFEMMRALNAEKADAANSAAEASASLQSQQSE